MVEKEPFMSTDLAPKRLQAYNWHIVFGLHDFSTTFLLPFYDLIRGQRSAIRKQDKHCPEAIDWGLGTGDSLARKAFSSINNHIRRVIHIFSVAAFFT